MQQERKRRLTASDIRHIQEIKAWGKAHQKNGKQIKAVLILALFWFYLLSALRRIWEKSIIRFITCTAAVSMVVILLLSYDSNRNTNGRLNYFAERTLKMEEARLDLAMVEEETMKPDGDLPDIKVLQKENQDCVGWLFIADTNISYPVMRHEEDKNFYLERDFYKNENSNGCLILDDGSDLERKGGNIIIHGHNMESGEMFGNLIQYKEESYAKEHSLIQLKTKEENRSYLVIAAFYSKVFYEDEDVFKYYRYFGGTKEDFEDFYSNIRELSVYDMEAEAIYGDEFITLSTCEYYVENGRFVVVGKRIY